MKKENLILRLKELNHKLNEHGIKREIIICGRAAILLNGKIKGAGQEETKDIDVLMPEVDSEMKKIIEEIGKKEHLRFDWMNNVPRRLQEELPKGWENRVEQLLLFDCLKVKSLSRDDLLAAKLFAMCARRKHDLEDILYLNPNKNEIDSKRSWLMERSYKPEWPERVELALAELNRRMLKNECEIKKEREESGDEFDIDF